MKLNVPGLKDAKSGFDPIPAGNYGLRVKQALLMDNKNNDGQHLRLDLEVTDTGEFEKRVVIHRLPLSEAGIGILKGACEVLGVDCEAESFTVEPPEGEKRHVLEFEGKEATGNITTEEYDGRMNNKLKYFVEPK